MQVQKNMGICKTRDGSYITGVHEKWGQRIHVPTTPHSIHCQIKLLAYSSYAPFASSKYTRRILIQQDIWVISISGDTKHYGIIEAWQAQASTQASTSKPFRLLPLSNQSNQEYKQLAVPIFSDSRERHTERGKRKQKKTRTPNSSLVTGLPKFIVGHW